MNSEITSLAASRRVGWRSAARIEPERSSEITMSMPESSSSSGASTRCGRVIATASSAMAQARRAGGRFTKRVPTVRGIDAMSLPCETFSRGAARPGSACTPR